MCNRRRSLSKEYYDEPQQDRRDHPRSGVAVVRLAAQGISIVRRRLAVLLDVVRVDRHLVLLARRGAFFEDAARVLGGRELRAVAVELRPCLLYTSPSPRD